MQESRIEEDKRYRVQALIGDEDEDQMIEQQIEEDMIKKAEEEEEDRMIEEEIHGTEERN